MEASAKASMGAKERAAQRWCQGMSQGKGNERQGSARDSSDADDGGKEIWKERTQVHSTMTRGGVEKKIVREWRSGLMIEWVLDQSFGPHSGAGS